LIGTIRAAVDLANSEEINAPIFVGGHSISGLMATIADAEQPLPADGIICIGYPRKGDPSRSAHLGKTSLPTLIIQGTQDTLGTTSEITEMIEGLGHKASVIWVEGAGHVFQVDGRDIRTVTSDIAKQIYSHIISRQSSRK